MITLALLAIMTVLMAFRVPVSIAIGIASLAALLIGDYPLEVAPRMMIDSVDSFTLLAVPFFVLAGNLMNAGGITERIFDFARACFGWLRGGLAQVNIAASMIFAGMSGAALADLAGLGAVEMKAMRDRGYPVPFSAAVTLASCTIGPIIPPSIVLVIYGLATDTSVGRLFLGGIVPGVTIGIIMMIFVALYVRLKRTSWGQPEAFDWSELGRTTRRGVLALLSPILVIGTIVGGISTPSEVGAIAAAYALFVGLVYRQLTWERLRKCLTDSVLTTAVIMYLIAVSSIMGWVITSERVAHDAAKLMVAWVEGPELGLIVINLFLLLVGMFLETVPALLILSSILEPVVHAFGIDPVHFGIVICFNLIIGIITPPMGIGLFVCARVASTTPEVVLRAVLPFLVPLGVALLVISLVPQITLWLPDLVFGKRLF